MASLSKSKIVLHRQCPRRLWLQRYQPELAPDDPGLDSVLREGERVGRLACAAYPQGIELPRPFDEALALTPELMARGDRPLFEATFVHQDVRVRADILIPAGRGHWRMVEVKSSGKVKDYHREDLAIQTWVLQHCGVKLASVALAHIDPNFVYPGRQRYPGLFAEQDLTRESFARAADVPAWAAAAAATLRKRKEPAAVPGGHCENPFPCPFAAHCAPAEKFPVELLPGTSGKKLAAALRAEGYGDLRKVPAARMSSERLRVVHRATVKNRPFVDPAASAQLAALPWPRYFIDFEMLGGPIPLWKGTRPFESLPFQWSCQAVSRSGRRRDHAFLADGRSDPRRAFIESLLAVLRTRGTVFIYGSSAESATLRRLAEHFPDLAADIDAVLARVVDLLPLARKHYYHRDQLGSWSIKTVLRTLAPELAYDDLAIAQGRAAQQAFERSLSDDIDDTERRALRQALLDYCQRDTLAMLTLVQYFEEHGNAC